MPGSYLPSDYMSVLFLLLFALGFGVAAIALGQLLRLRRPYHEKLVAYESGNEPTELPRFRFSVKFYLIAILFAVFDVECIFLYPWAIVYDKLGLFAFAEMLIFIFLLLAGYVYAWGKGALTWER
ncbi:MAG TPA: NADH-quinone oxidoreductase subunit A [Thermodesulfobacteriaceae bacterium]|nr:NADH-quinone oxidoreductase subunit A [Thermodesulfobacteriaceae bacterium]